MRAHKRDRGAAVSRAGPKEKAKLRVKDTHPTLAKHESEGRLARALRSLLPARNRQRAPDNASRKHGQCLSAASQTGPAAGPDAVAAKGAYKKGARTSRRLAQVAVPSGVWLELKVA